VYTLTLAVPGSEMMALVIVICNCVLLVTTVLSFVPLITPTEDATNLRPFTVRTKPCCTSANVIVLTERDAMAGAGRALPQKGSSALQPWRTIEASRRAARDRNRAFIRFIQDRTMFSTKSRMPSGRIQEVSSSCCSAILALPPWFPCLRGDEFKPDAPLLTSFARRNGMIANMATSLSMATAASPSAIVSMIPTSKFRPQS
jgi:hypothetical protein